MKKNKFPEKVLKHYAYELCHDMEIEMLNVFVLGVQDSWLHNLELLKGDSMLYERLIGIAAKNKRSTDFSDLDNFTKNLFWSDYAQIILILAKKGNSYFSKFFSNSRDKALLLNASTDASRLRNISAHPVNTIYFLDIKEFLQSAIIICNILNISSLGVRFKKKLTDLERDIINSKFYEELSYQPVNHNLPYPEYEKWYGLVGRDIIKQQIIEVLNEGRDRVIAITGGGGIGKSALAINIGYELLKPEYFNFKHIIWITSKSNYLDASGVKDLSNESYYVNNYKDFLNKFISGFWGELFFTDIDNVDEEKIESEAVEILESNNRILLIIDNLENIDDPKILEFIKFKVFPPNYVLITSRKGLGEINRTFPLKSLDDNAAFLLFKNLCKYYEIGIERISINILKEFIKKTNNYPLVIKWCVELVAKRNYELEKAFGELEKADTPLVEFIFRKVYKDLDKTSKRLLKALAIYKDIPDRNIIAYIAGIRSEIELSDATFELEQYALVSQERFESKSGIVEVINVLPLIVNFIKNIADGDKSIMIQIEEKLHEIESINIGEISDLRPAQKLAQSKLLKALEIMSKKVVSEYKEADKLVIEAQRLAPRFYKIPFYKALIAMTNLNYQPAEVIQYFDESLSYGVKDGRLYFEYGIFLKKHRPGDALKIQDILSKAYEFDRKIGYGIEALKTLKENKNYSQAIIIINKLIEENPDFPKDDQQKILLLSVFLERADQVIEIDNDCFFNLLVKVESWFSVIEDKKDYEYRIMKAKYFSLLSLKNIINTCHIEARMFLQKSEEILDTYRSTHKAKIGFEKVYCQNLINAIYLAESSDSRKKIYGKLNNEFNAPMKDDLVKNFHNQLKRIRKVVFQ